MFYWIPSRLFLCCVLFNDIQYLGLCSVGWMIRKQEGVEASRELLRTNKEKLRNKYLDSLRAETLTRDFPKYSIAFTIINHVMKILVLTV
jgi:hypothetical protein